MVTTGGITVSTISMAKVKVLTSNSFGEEEISDWLKDKLAGLSFMSGDDTNVYHGQLPYPELVSILCELDRENASIVKDEVVIDIRIKYTDSEELPF